MGPGTTHLVSFDHDSGWTSILLLSAGEVSSVLADCHALTERAPAELDPRDKPVAGTRHLRKLDARLPLVAEVLERWALRSVVEQIVGPNPALQQAEYRCPQSGFGGQRLHADWLPKLDDEPDQVATAIVALTNFSADNGATRIVPGSHRRPDLQRVAGQLESHRDEVVLTGEAGTAFVFSGHVLHAGGMNNSRAERPALQLVWNRASE